MSYLQSAFEAVCKEAKPATGSYVCLMEESQRYGGPEEGGWWTTDVTLVAYQWCATEEEADAKRAAVEQLEARGLDADWQRVPRLCYR